jgi:K+-transporting ATPase A subunit
MQAVLEIEELGTAELPISTKWSGGQRQILTQDPAASLEVIKNLGTNGGGFFNVSGAHPYANPVHQSVDYLASSKLNDSLLNGLSLA